MVLKEDLKKITLLSYYLCVEQKSVFQFFIIFQKLFEKPQI